MVLALSSYNVSTGDCIVNDGFGRDQFIPTLPSSHACGIFSALAYSAQAQVVFRTCSETERWVPG